MPPSGLGDRAFALAGQKAENSGVVLGGDRQDEAAIAWQSLLLWATGGIAGVDPTAPRQGVRHRAPSPFDAASSGSRHAPAGNSRPREQARRNQHATGHDAQDGPRCL